MSTDDPYNSSLPPRHNQLLLELTEQTLLLATVLHELIDGIEQGDTKKAIGQRLRYAWVRAMNMRKMDMENVKDGLLAKRFFAGDDATEREFIHKQVISIYGELVNAIPASPRCEVCGRGNSDNEDDDDEEITLCGGCDTFMCVDCFETHRCTGSTQTTKLR